MQLIGLFFPALISLKLSMNRNIENSKNILQVILRYGIYALCINWLAQVLITYILNISDVTVDALASFPFFAKYTFIAAVIAVFLPILEELIKKYIKITIKTGVDVEKDKCGKKSN